MKSILDPSSDYTPSVATGIRKTFERAWRELDEREQLEEDSDVARDSVWLECNSDLVDSGRWKSSAFIDQPWASRWSSSCARAATSITSPFDFAERSR